MRTRAGCGGGQGGDHEAEDELYSGIRSPPPCNMALRFGYPGRFHLATEDGPGAVFREERWQGL